MSDTTERPDLGDASVPGGTPAWFDPNRDAMLTPSRLRGLVHPIRVRLLTLLQYDGPATATQLARRINSSSGVTSYHLRMLAEHGFVEEDRERGNGRDRYWRARYRTTAFTFRSPDDPADAESLEVAELYLRMVVDGFYERMVGFVDSLSMRREQLAQMPWTLGDTQIQLTHDEARALAADVNQLVDRYRREPPGSEVTTKPRAGTVPAMFQFQLMPDDPRPYDAAPR